MDDDKPKSSGWKQTSRFQKTWSWLKDDEDERPEEPPAKGFAAFMHSKGFRQSSMFSFRGSPPFGGRKQQAPAPPEPEENEPAAESAPKSKPKAGFQRTSRFGYTLNLRDHLKAKAAAKKEAKSTPAPKAKPPAPRPPAPPIPTWKKATPTKAPPPPRPPNRPNPSSPTSAGRVSAGKGSK